MPTTQRRHRSQGIADEAADDGGDESLQPDQESGVVIQRRDRHDQDSRNRADHGSEQERDLSRQRGADADQPGAEAIDGGGAQRLAVERQPEEQPETDDEGHRDGVDGKALAGEAQRPQRDGRIGDRRAALAFGAEKHQPKTLQRQMAADRGDQQHQHRGVRQRLEHDAIEEQPDRGHDQKRQRDRDGDRRMAAGEPGGEGEDQRGQDDIDREGAADAFQMQRFAVHEQIEAERHDPHRHRQPGGAWHLARRQRGIGQRAIGDELALRNQDHAGDGEHQHQRQPEQRIDRAVGNAVLHQEQHDRRVQDRTLPLTPRPAQGFGKPPDRPITAVEKCWRYLI